MIGLLLVHTVTMTLNEIELCARFYHTLYSDSQRSASPMTLVGQNVAVTFNKQRGLCRQLKHRNQPRLHHRVQTVYM